MAEINNSDGKESSEDDDEPSVEKVQIYTSISKGNHEWLRKIANRKKESKSGVVRKLIHNARVKDENLDEDIVL